MASPSLDIVRELAFSAAYVKAGRSYSLQKAANYETLEVLVEHKVLSETMAKKMAGSGLNYEHLVSIQQRRKTGGRNTTGR